LGGKSLWGETGGVWGGKKKKENASKRIWQGAGGAFE